jgi:hypothetical protein
MRLTRVALAAAIAAICISPLSALADHRSIQGRTGLPTVREGQQNVWMNNGQVRLQVVGDRLLVTQDYRLRYPGPPIEKGSETVRVAVREDFFRSIDDGAPKVTTDEARGFQDFAVYVDGRRMTAKVEPWKLNEKEDTATRWRTWAMTFRPNQVRTMRIISRAPLGRYDGQPWVNFVSKDLGHWRQSPDYLQIRLESPGVSESRLVGLEPKPDNINPRAVQWVYRKADPDRDVFALLPSDYNGRSVAR